MIPFDLQPFLAFQAGSQPCPDLYLIWGIHEGSRGSTWIVVGGDGRVKQTRSISGQTTQEDLGEVPLQAVRDLTEAVLRSRLESSATDPIHRLTLELRSGETRGEWAFQPGAPPPDLPSAFLHIKTLAARGAAPPPAPQLPAPLETPLAPQYRSLLWIIGCFTLGVGAVGLWATWRRFPRRMDAQGLTLRNGRRYVWHGLQLRKRVAADAPDEVLGYDLLAPDGSEIRIAPAALANGLEAMAYIRARLEAQA